MTTKIIQAKAIISAEDKTGAVLASIGRKLKDLGKGAKVSAEVDRLTKSLGKAHSQMRAIDQFRGAQSGFIAARDKFRQTQAAVEAAARAMAAAERPTRALQSALASAQRDVSRAAAAYERHKDAVLGAKRAMEGMGVPTKGVAAQQARLRSVIEQSSAALARQEAHAERRAARRQALGLVGAGAGIVAAGKGKDLGFRAITSAAEFDIAVRKQRAFTDVSAQDQGPLIAQAKKIGQETPFSNSDVVKAQTASMQGLPAAFTPSQKAQVAQGITAATRNLALVMETNLSEASEMIRTYLQTAGKDISSGPKATTEANKAVNQMVRAAKIGGMDANDVGGFLKYAVGSGTAAGLSTDTLLSLGALARRGGLRGDEAGVFVRSAAGKLSSPTRGGLAALSAAGINYGDYQRAPKSLDVGRLESQFQNQLGTSFSPAVKERLAKVLSDPAALRDQGSFTAAVKDAVGPDFAQKKGGAMKAADASKIARSAGQFYRLSSGGVNSEGLLDAIMNSGMGLAGLNELLTGKHGGKGAITAKQWDDFKASRDAVKAAGDDPDYAKKRADEIMGGLGGALENLKGSFENLVTSVGTANESILKLSFDKLGAAMDALSTLPNAALQAGAALTALAATAAGIAGTLKLAGMVFGGGGAAGAAGLAAAGAAGAGAAAGGAAAGGMRGALGGFAGTLLAAGRAVAGPVGLVGGLGAMVKGTADAYGYRPASGPGSGAYGKALRSSLDEQYGTSRGGVSASGSGGAGGKVEAVVSGPVTATLSGSATVEGSTKIEVVVSASSELLSAVASAKSASAALKGSLNAGGGNGPGSTGKSSPDAAAGGTGAQ